MKGSFADKLGAVLAEREMGYRTLAKLIDPDNIESGRRSIRRWMKGEQKPNRASMDAVTDALGLEREALDPDDEEESLYAALVASLNPDKLRRALEAAA